MAEPKPGKAAQGRATRQRIEDAAIAVLSAQGLDGFTASRLASAADISKASLYHHFDSLDEIMIASFERLIMGMEAFRPLPGTGYRAWLTLLGASLLETGLAEGGALRAYVMFFAKAMFDPALSARLDQVLTGAVETTADIVAELDPRADDRAAQLSLARLIVATLDGLMMHALAAPGHRREAEAAWSAFVDRVAPEGEEE